MQDAPKTTYQDLSNASTTGVTALINGVSADEKAALHVPTTTESCTHTPPAIGQYWLGQGGYYAGIVRDGDHQWHVIAADKTLGHIESEWGTYGETITGEFSRRDGQHNTALILAAEPDNKIASHFTALLIDGHKDFYWPSQFEQNLCCINLPEHFTPEWHWSSTQRSAHYAWFQGFGDGYQYFDGKDSSLAARAVRRLPI